MNPNNINSNNYSQNPRRQNYPSNDIDDLRSSLTSPLHEADYKIYLEDSLLPNYSNGGGNPSIFNPDHIYQDPLDSQNLSPYGDPVIQQIGSAIPDAYDKLGNRTALTGYGSAPQDYQTDYDLYNNNPSNFTGDSFNHYQTDYDSYNAIDDDHYSSTPYGDNYDLPFDPTAPTAPTTSKKKSSSKKKEVKYHQNRECKKFYENLTEKENAERAKEKDRQRAQRYREKKKFEAQGTELQQVNQANMRLRREF